MAAPQSMPSEAHLTRMRNILHYGSFGGGYGVEQGKLMSTTDELFLGKQDSHSMWHGLYPLLTMIRHSCCPNSVISYVDESAMLRATLDLAAGDQVTINYMAPLSVPVKDRQQRLQNSQDFTCVCPRCTVEGKLPSSIQTKIQAIHALLRSEAQHQLWHSPAGNSKAKQGEDLARQSGTKARQHQGNAKTSVVDQDRHLLGTSLAQRVEQLLKELATDLGNTDLPMRQQHWVLFSVLEAYMYCKKCLLKIASQQEVERQMQSLCASASSHRKCLCCTVVRCLATAVILLTCFAKLSLLTSIF
ncbi:TPA: N-lysine methyltransferase smyd2 [Trebouxia sp. C0006]